MEKRFLWENDVLKRKNARILVRLMKKTGSNYHEVAFEAGGIGIQSKCFVSNISRIF